MASRDMDTLYATVLIFGVLSAVVYQFILRPLLPSGRHVNNNNNNNTNNPRQAAPAYHTSLRQQQQQRKGIKCARVPEHVAPNSAKIAVNGGNNLLVDGMIAFRHTKAALAETSGDASQLAMRRKERARVLSRLLSDAPPAKGSTVVLAIPERDVGCAQLQKVVYLMATYYNLLLLLAVPAAFDRSHKLELLQKLRARVMPPEVLPNHRIVLTSTVAGRVAFCRQLQRIELVLDFDPEVKGLLGRFGHRVVVYSSEDGNQKSGLSLLGEAINES